MGPLSLASGHLGDLHDTVAEGVHPVERDTELGKVANSLVPVLDLEGAVPVGRPSLKGGGQGRVIAFEKEVALTSAMPILSYTKVTPLSLRSSQSGCSSITVSAMMVRWNQGVMPVAW